ncbi:MAG: BrnA antitoxin family protein [Azoarcus sp.]|jgi:uncharacterized protein (DUF4415 family)|nr:BrnA antitoxin family protein [Azoarcus sp.]
MKAGYDFSGAKRGAVAETKGKTRITIWIDDAVLVAFRERAGAAGKGYQTLMNDALKAAIDEEKAALVTLSALRRVLREELHPA